MKNHHFSQFSGSPPPLSTGFPRESHGILRIPAGTPRDSRESRQSRGNPAGFFGDGIPTGFPRDCRESRRDSRGNPAGSPWDSRDTVSFVSIMIFFSFSRVLSSNLISYIIIDIICWFQILNKMWCTHLQSKSFFFWKRFGDTRTLQPLPQGGDVTGLHFKGCG